MVDDILYGLQLTFETNSPFGYGIPKTTKLKFTQEDATNGVKKVVLDTSDEIGYTYPKMIIKVLAGGNLSIKNPAHPNYQAITRGNDEKKE